MKQFRGQGQSKPSSDVIDLLDSDEETALNQRQQQQQLESSDDGLAVAAGSPIGRAAIRSRRAAAVAATKKLTQTSPAAAGEYDGEYEFISDDDVAGVPKPQPEQQQRKIRQSQQRITSTQQGLQNGKQDWLTAATQQQSPVRKGSSSKRTGAATGKMQPPAKRAKAGAARKPVGGNAATGNRKTTLQSKGFGSLFLSMSQPTAAAGGGAGIGQLQLSSSQGLGSQDGCSSQPQSARSVTPAPAPTAASTAADTQWVNVYAPSTPDDLIVHKRKVSEVQAWLQGYLDTRSAAPSRALLITGPSGCGKSATLHVLASSLGFEVVEWNAPVPTLWSDYQYQAGAGVGYASKLDEFDMFVTRCKFAALPLACSTSKTSQQQQQQSQQPSSQQPPSQQQQQQRHKGPLKLLLVEDLPYVGEASRRARLAAALHELATTARCPVVVVATTEEGSSSSSRAGGGYGSYGGAAAGVASSKGLHKDFLAVLDKIGATHISFNAITANNITKGLHTIADKEGFILQQDVADGIAQAAAGDLRNAVHNLQLMHLQQQTGVAVAAARGPKAGSKSKAKAPKRPRRVIPKDAESMAAAEAAKQKVAGQVSRDQHLSVFHAVGKILHYKRNQPEDAAAAARSDGAQEQQQQHATGNTAAAAAAGAAVAEDDGIDLCSVDVDAPQMPRLSSTRLWRPPLRIDPESIVQGSALEALQVTAFLAENYPHFFADDATEEVAAAAAYLSDAGYLACRRNTSASSSSFWDEADTVASSVQEAAASSVAARGLLFSNTRPAPSRWLPLRGSSCFQPERAAAANLLKLGAAVQHLQDSWASADPVEQQAVMQLAGPYLHAGRQERASQVLPYLQVLCKHDSRMWMRQMLPTSWCHVWGGQVTERQSAAVQGTHVTAALQAAVMAAAGGVLGDTRESSEVTEAHDKAGAANMCDDQIEDSD